MILLHLALILAVLRKQHREKSFAVKRTQFDDDDDDAEEGEVAISVEEVRM
jgi:hypothetical protein